MTKWRESSKFETLLPPQALIHGAQLPLVKEPAKRV